MLSRTLANLIGVTINGLHLNTILRFDGQWPVYGADCSQCGARGVPVHHRLARLGAARCIASGHEEAAKTKAADKTRDRRAVLSLEAEAQVAMFDARQETERMRRGAVDALQQKRIEDEYRRYARHALIEWGYDANQLISRESWRKIGDSGREQVMRRIEEDRC